MLLIRDDDYDDDDYNDDDYDDDYNDDDYDDDYDVMILVVLILLV